MSKKSELTVRKFKDEIAKKHGYPRWGNLLHDLVDGNVPIQFVDECEDEVFELYTKSIRMSESDLNKLALERADYNVDPVWEDEKPVFVQGFKDAHAILTKVES